MKKSSFRIMLNTAAFLLVFMTISRCTKDTEPEMKDTELPAIVSVEPADKMISVPRNTVLKVVFSEPIDTSTLDLSSFKLRRGASLVNGRITCNTDTTATFTPLSRLEGSTTYTATISTGVTDISNNAISQEFIWSFETEVAADETAPGIIAVTPSANATQVPVNGRPSVTFNEPMNLTTINSSTFLVKQGTTLIPGTIDISENTAVFIPSVILENSKTYTVVLTGNVEDIAGNPLQSEYIWSFTTGAPADVTKPVVSSVDPAANAVSVAVNASPQVTFNEPVDPSSVTNTTFTLKQGSNIVPGTVTVAGNAATFSPTSALAANTTYSVTVTTGVKDIAGNTLGSNYSWTFTTAASTPVDVTKPVVSSVNPAANAVSIPVNAKPQVTFSEPVDASSITNTTFTLKQGTTVVPGTVSVSGSTATFSPNSSLAANTAYSATVTTGVKDVAGNTLASNYSWSFTTAASTPVDVTKPVVSSVNPAANAVSIPVNAKPQVTFSEPVDASSITNTTFTLKQGTTVVPGTVTVSGSTATFSPTSALAANTTYSATVTTGVKDIAGNTLGSNYSWTFTTAASTPVDVTKPVVSSVNPAANAVSIPVNAKPQVTFSEPVDASSITNTTFSLKQGTTVVPGTVTVSGSTATFSPTSALAANTTYSVTVTTGVKDIAGNTLGSNYSWTFTTAAAAPAAKSFAADVVPVLNKCNECHNHKWTPSSTPSTFHANLVNSGHISLTTPTNGKIYSKVNGGHPSSGVTSEQKTTVLTWIKEGSKNN